MEVLNSNEQTQTQASPALATRPRVNTGAPNMAVAMRRTSRIPGGIRLKGRTSGVVVGELVDLVIKDRFGKSHALWTKVEGNGKFQVLTKLKSCATDRLKLTAVTTSLDGTCLKSESSWVLDLPGDVSNVSLLDERYEEYNYVQASLTNEAESHHGDLLPASFPWTDGTRHHMSEDGIYAINSHGLITIVPILKP
jgi:hypothetical protein